MRAALLPALVALGCGGSSIVARDASPAADAAAVADVARTADASPVTDAAVVVDAAMIADAAGNPPGPDGGALPASGLVLLDRETVPGGHLAELLVRDDAVYVASSFSGINVFHVDADGHLYLTQSGYTASGPPTSPRCTTLAAHAPTLSLYCAAADTAGVSSYDLRDATAPPLRAGADLDLGPHAGHRQIAVAADSLFLAAFDRGLLRAAIAADGTVGPPAPTALTAGVFGVAADGANLVALDLDGRLSSFRVAGAALTPAGSLDLGGPPIRAVVRGARAVVALGSQGVSVVSLGDAGPALAFHVDPGCPATAADLGADRLAVTCTTGLYLYDLTGAAPRVAGFYPAAGTMLDARFVGDRLVVLDWNDVLFLQTRPDGHATRPDLTTGYALHAGEDAAFAVRNPGDLTLHVHATLDHVGPTPVADVTIPPFATGTVTIAAALLDGSLRSETVRLRVDEDPLPSTAAIAVLPAPTTPPAPLAHVAAGDPFPALRDATGGGGPAVPAAGVRTTYSFVQPDCAMQWPQVQEAGWAQRHGRPIDHAASFVFVVPSSNADDWNRVTFMALWGAGSVPFRHFGDYTRSIAGHEGDDYNAVYGSIFGLTSLISGPDVQADHAVDERGIITGVEHFYRGDWPLRP